MTVDSVLEDEVMEDSIQTVEKMEDLLRTKEISQMEGFLQKEDSTQKEEMIVSTDH